MIDNPIRHQYTPGQVFNICFCFVICVWIIASCQKHADDAKVRIKSIKSKSPKVEHSAYISPRVDIVTPTPTPLPTQTPQLTPVAAITPNPEIVPK